MFMARLEAKEKPGCAFMVIVKVGAVLQKSSKFQTCSMAKLSVSIVQVCSPDGATKV